MIREKAILCKLIHIDISDAQLIDSFDSAGLSQKACPKCGAEGVLKPHGSYRRSMITITGGARKEEKVMVRRARCRSCRGTHALLPDALLPFGSYSLRFVIHSLKAYMTRQASVAALCESLQIAVSTLYEWIRLFVRHANLLLAAAMQASWVTAKAVGFIEGIDSLPSLFFRRFGFSFLEHRKRHEETRAPG